MFKKLTVITLFIAGLLPTGSGAIQAQEGDGIVITLENTDQLAELARFGWGSWTTCAFSPLGDTVRSPEAK